MRAMTMSGVNIGLVSRRSNQIAIAEEDGMG